MKSLLISVLVLLHTTGSACLNEEHVTKNGKRTSGNFTLSNLTFYKGHDVSAIESKLKTLMGLPVTTKDDDRSIKNDIAVQYIKLGRYEEAEKLLLELQQQYPADYSINVNLGTLYELQGKNKEALQLIKKSVSINPGSHEGSEWFHIKILEYKLKHIPEDKIAGQNILDIYSIKKSGDEVADEISYQLQERIPFTPAPDMIMAKVLQEFADFLADSVSIEGAYLMYSIGMDYDRNNVLQLAAKKEALIPYFKKYHQTVPQTGVYYLDKILPVNNEDKIKTAASILKEGFNYFSEQEQKREEERKRKQYMIFGAVGLLAVVLLGLFIYKRRKQD
ncbi:tetratricopeptide repeat protein [Ferruginibacter sp.]